MSVEKLQSTRSAFLWTRILSTPFYVLFTLLPYILYKDEGATLLQVTTLIILKPAVSLLAPYWSVWVVKRPDRLIQNLCWANILKFIPFLLIPFIENITFLTLACSVYLVLGRGVVPAWMELLKLNIPSDSRTKVFAYGQAFDYLGIALFPLSFGWMLDSYHESWRYFFFFTALIGIISTLFLFRIPSQKVSILPETSEMADTLFKPWKLSWDLIRLKPDFGRFQLGFMWGGAGLMIFQPALPLFFTETLNLSYREMTIALAFCKGIGYAAATPWWAKMFAKVDIFRFCTWVTFLAALFPLALLMSEFNLTWLWIAFLGYGVMQAGSELSWHLSGPTFSQQADSSVYSQTNIVTQGIRGAITPYLGYCVCEYAGAQYTLVLGSILCLLATFQMGKERFLVPAESQSS